MHNILCLFSIWTCSQYFNGCYNNCVAINCEVYDNLFLFVETNILYIKTTGDVFCKDIAIIVLCNLLCTFISTPKNTSYATALM